MIFEGKISMFNKLGAEQVEWADALFTQMSVGDLSDVDKTGQVADEEIRRCLSDLLAVEELQTLREGGLEIAEQAAFRYAVTTLNRVGLIIPNFPQAESSS